MEAEEDSYVTMLRGARKIGEILEIKDRLSSVRQEIESMKSQSAVLANQSDLSTINITLEQQSKVDEPAPSTSPSQDAWTNAVSGLHQSLLFLGILGIYALVYAPIWLTIGIVLWIVQRRARMR
jgi:hypothetical protein